MCFFYEVENSQAPSLRQGVSLLRENINMFMNVTYYVSFLYIQDIQYDSITLYKGKFQIKYLFGTRLHYS